MDYQISLARGRAWAWREGDLARISKAIGRNPVEFDATCPSGPPNGPLYFRLTSDMDKGVRS